MNGNEDVLRALERLQGSMDAMSLQLVALFDQIVAMTRATITREVQDHERRWHTGPNGGPR